MYTWVYICIYRTLDLKLDSGLLDEVHRAGAPVPGDSKPLVWTPYLDPNTYPLYTALWQVGQQLCTSLWIGLWSKYCVLDMSSCWTRAEGTLGHGVYYELLRLPQRQTSVPSFQVPFWLTHQFGRWSSHRAVGAATASIVSYFHLCPDSWHLPTALSIR